MALARRAPLLMAALFALAAGCGGGGGGSGDGARNLARQVSVELLEPGAEPRSPLRLATGRGTQGRSTMTVRIGLQTSIDGQAQPAAATAAFTVDVLTDVTDVSSEGDVTAEFSYENAGQAEGVPASLETAKQLTTLNGIAGTLVISSRGALVDADIDLPDGLDPGVTRLVEELSEQLGNLAVPFPEEPVGIGARWQARSPLRANGIDTRLDTTYTLRERDGNRYGIDLAYRQTAPAQEPDIPGVPAGADVRLVDFQVEGSGEVTGDLAVLLPRRSTVSAAGDIVTAITAEGETSELRQHLETRVELSSAT